jgi:hypothetical protein
MCTINTRLKRLEAAQISFMRSLCEVTRTYKTKQSEAVVQEAEGNQNTWKERHVFRYVVKFHFMNLMEGPNNLA